MTFYNIADWIAGGLTVAGLMWRGRRVLNPGKPIPNDGNASSHVEHHVSVLRIDQPGEMQHLKQISPEKSLHLDQLTPAEEQQLKQLPPDRLLPFDQLPPHVRQQLAQLRPDQMSTLDQLPPDVQRRLAQVLPDDGKSKFNIQLGTKTTFGLGGARPGGPKYSIGVRTNFGKRTTPQQ